MSSPEQKLISRPLCSLLRSTPALRTWHYSTDLTCCSMPFQVSAHPPPEKKTPDEMTDAEHNAWTAEQCLFMKLSQPDLSNDGAKTTEKWKFFDLSEGPSHQELRTHCHGTTPKGWRWPHLSTAVPRSVRISSSECMTLCYPGMFSWTADSPSRLFPTLRSHPSFLFSALIGFVSIRFVSTTDSGHKLTDTNQFGVPSAWRAGNPYLRPWNLAVHQPVYFVVKVHPCAWYTVISVLTRFLLTTSITVSVWRCFLSAALPLANVRQFIIHSVVQAISHKSRWPIRQTIGAPIRQLGAILSPTTLSNMINRVQSWNWNPTVSSTNSWTVMWTLPERTWDQHKAITSWSEEHKDLWFPRQNVNVALVVLLNSRFVRHKYLAQRSSHYYEICHKKKLDWGKIFFIKGDIRPVQNTNTPAFHVALGITNNH